MTRESGVHRAGTMILVGTLIVVAVLVIGGAIYGNATRKSCAELRADMLDMTGPTATEEYDVDRVREINDDLDRQGCNS